MENKNFVAYEYATKTVKASKQSRAMDMYEAFGWEVTEVTPALVDGVTISMKRDRHLVNKAELNRLERKAEEIAKNIDDLECKKTLGGSVFGYIFGSVSALVLGGGMSLALLQTTNLVALVGGIALGVVGGVLASLTYPIYKRIVDKKTSKLLPIIDDNEEKLANVLEQANALLMAKEI